MLELLLAARHSLYMSHTGRSVRDNTPLPPSVLVAELLDLLVPAIAEDPSSPQSLSAARQRLVVEHPLQPFALQAFDAGGDARLRSYHHELAEAVRGSLEAQPQPLPPQALAAEGAEPDASGDDALDEDAAAEAPRAPFFRAALAPPGPEWRQVSLAQLQEFFRNPCRALLRRRLGIELARDEDELLDDEPFLPDARGRAALAERLLPLLLQGTPAEALPALARAGTELPGGTLGEGQLQRELQSLQAFAGTLRDALAPAPLPPQAHTLQFQLDGEPWQLQWSFADLRPSGLLRWHYAPTRAGDRLAAWLQHLALCAAPPDGVAPRTRWLSSDGEFSLAPCSDAAARLQELLALYRRGLSEPLHFYPRTSWAFEQGGAGAARAAWQSLQGWAEGDDLAYQLALRGVDAPLDAQFETLAQAVYAPLRSALQDDRE
jgi:exodeoxyribonuclease V gamma subunit